MWKRQAFIIILFVLRILLFLCKVTKIIKIKQKHIKNILITSNQLSYLTPRANYLPKILTSHLLNERVYEIHSTQLYCPCNLISKSTLHTQTLTTWERTCHKPHAYAYYLYAFFISILIICNRVCVYVFSTVYLRTSHISDEWLF